MWTGVIWLRIGTRGGRLCNAASSLRVQ